MGGRTTRAPKARSGRNFGNGQLGRRWRTVLHQRGELERAATRAHFAALGRPAGRLEEGEALKLFKTLPSVFSLMEDATSGFYHRPQWALFQYGKS